MRDSYRKSLKRVLTSVGNLMAHALTGGLVALPSIALMRRSREEEVAVGYNMIATCLIAGIIMAVAKPLAKYITGIDLDNPAGDIPTELVNMMSRLFSLITYLGVIILVIGLIMAGINLARRPKSPKN